MCISDEVSGIKVTWRTKMIDYHDFVFKDGRLIGDFEGMYQMSSEIPWHQDVQDKDDIILALNIIERHGPFDTVMDVGCGLGYFLDSLTKRLRPSLSVGLDISTTACVKASSIFPGYTFIQSDITRGVPDGHGRRVVVCMRGLFWYVFDHLNDIVHNISSINPVKELYVLVSQNFPPLCSSFVGKECISCPEDLIAPFAQHFSVLEHVQLVDKVHNENDNWTICLMKREGVKNG